MDKTARIRELVDIAAYAYQLGLALKAGKGRTVAHICVYEMSLACNGICVAECVSLAGIGVAVCAFQYGHCVVEAIFAETEYTRNSWSKVGSVVLELSCAERLLEGVLLVHELVDSIGLVAVGNDELVAENSYGSIDDEVGCSMCAGRPSRLLFSSK